MSMDVAAAVERASAILAHAWMVRTFLKHADEIQGDADMLAVPRTLYDSIRAVEPARERGDHAEYLRRLKGKLGKLRKVSVYFRDNFRRFSPHTNFEMASVSLLGVVRELDELFAAIDLPAILATAPKPTADPLDDLDIPEV